MDNLEAILLRIAENFACSSHLIQIKFFPILSCLVSKNTPGKNASKVIIVSSRDGLIRYDFFLIVADHDAIFK